MFDYQIVSILLFNQCNSALIATSKILQRRALSGLGCFPQYLREGIAVLSPVLTRWFIPIQSTPCLMNSWLPAETWVKMLQKWGHIVASLDFAASQSTALLWHLQGQVHSDPLQQGWMAQTRAESSEYASSTTITTIWHWKSNKRHIHVHWTKHGRKVSSSRGKCICASNSINMSQTFPIFTDWM